MGYKKSLNASFNEPIYFRKNGKWQILYTLKFGPYIYNDELFLTFRLDREGKNIPPKYDMLYLLKDIQNDDTYSNFLNSDKTYDTSDFPENQLKYGKRASLEPISFTKETILSVPYSYLPSEFGGPVVYSLKIGGEDFKIKFGGTKGAGFKFSPLISYINLFEVPTKFMKKDMPTFSYYRPTSNWFSDNKAGVFVIRKK